MMVKRVSQVAGQVFLVPEGQRSIEKSVGFGLSHRFRIEIRRALHDRPASAAELAKRLGQPRHRLRYHIEELLKDGSIEVADKREAGNMTQNIYRLTKIALNSAEDWQAMPNVDRQIEAALILQGTWTEALASLWQGKFHSDPDVVNVWNRIPLDEEGRQEFCDELEQSWNRIEGIEAEAATRRANSGELGKRYIAACFGYKRGRNAAPAPQPEEIGYCESTTDLRPSGRPVEEAVSRAVAHRIRVEILAALHEGPSTAAGLGRMLGQTPSVLHYHLRQLLKDGAIRVVGHVHFRNLEQVVYAYVKLPVYDYDDWWSLSPQERQVNSAITLRAGMAESLVALWRGKLYSDPRLILAWKPIVLDAIGRAALADEQRRSWHRICEIESNASERLSASAAKGEMHIVTFLGFERSRSA